MSRDKLKKNILAIIMVFAVLFSLGGCTDTKLPEEMPEDFSFSIHWGYFGYYDSSTKILKYGYNYDSDLECKTTLELTNKQLAEIYVILKNVKIDTLPDRISVSHVIVTPAYTPYIKYLANNATKSVYIDYATAVKVEEWSGYKEFGYAFEKIVADYITSSDEYRSLPPNQFLVD